MIFDDLPGLNVRSKPVERRENRASEIAAKVAGLNEPIGMNTVCIVIRISQLFDSLPKRRYKIIFCLSKGFERANQLRTFRRRIIKNHRQKS
jgi:hypothetical protein